MAASVKTEDLEKAIRSRIFTVKYDNANFAKYWENVLAFLSCIHILPLYFSDILKDADLDSLSAKKVRRKLEESFGIELTER